jgi:hypothetical protein
MSGPIVRKYGFPNFEQIFGKREPQHGVEEGPRPSEAPAQPEAPEKADEKPVAPRDAAPG